MEMSLRASLQCDAVRVKNRTLERTPVQTQYASQTPFPESDPFDCGAGSAVMTVEEDPLRRP
jgi:hypothetical protein